MDRRIFRRQQDLQSRIKKNNKKSQWTSSKTVSNNTSSNNRLDESISVAAVAEKDRSVTDRRTRVISFRKEQHAMLEFVLIVVIEEVVARVQVDLLMINVVVIVIIKIVDLVVVFVIIIIVLKNDHGPLKKQKNDDATSQSSTRSSTMNNVPATLS